MKFHVINMSTNTGNPTGLWKVLFYSFFLCLLFLPFTAEAQAVTTKSAILLSSYDKTIQFFDGKDLKVDNGKVGIRSFVRSDNRSSSISEFIAGDHLTVITSVDDPNRKTILNKDIDARQTSLSGRITWIDWSKRMLKVKTVGLGITRELRFPKGGKVGFSGGREFSFRYLRAGDTVRVLYQKIGSARIASRLIKEMTYERGWFHPTSCQIQKAVTGKFFLESKINIDYSGYQIKSPLQNSAPAFRNAQLGIIPCSETAGKLVNIGGSIREKYLEIENAVYNGDLQSIGRIRGKVISTNHTNRYVTVRSGANIIKVFNDPQTWTLNTYREKVKFTQLKNGSDVTVFAVNPNRSSVIATLVRVNQL